MAKQHGPGTNLSTGRKNSRGYGDETLRRGTAIACRSTSSSGVMSQRQICPSWQPVMMVLKSSITSRLLMQWVGAMRPHSTMGRTRPFPDMTLMCLEGGEQHAGTDREGERSEGRGEMMKAQKFERIIHCLFVLTDTLQCRGEI